MKFDPRFTEVACVRNLFAPVNGLFGGPRRSASHAASMLHGWVRGESHPHARRTGNLWGSDVFVHILPIGREIGYLEDQT